MTHSQFHDLTVGCYRPGQFYSEAICGVPWEQDFLFPGGVGREDCCGLQHTINGNIHESIIIQPWGLPAEAGTSRGGPEKTRRLIILLHETSHLLHDLSLGVCMVLDSILDITSAMVLDCVKSLSLEKEIQCPLLSDGSSPRWVHTPQSLLSWICFPCPTRYPKVRMDCLLRIRSMSPKTAQTVQSEKT